MKNWKKHILMGIYIVLSFACMSGCGNRPIKVPTYDEELEPAQEISMFAIVGNIDEVNNKITLKAVNYSTEITLAFSGGCDVRDKYGELLSMSQVELGSVVDAVYDANRDKLLSMYMSGNDKVEERKEVSGAHIDYLEHTMEMDGKTYKLSSNASAYSDNREIGLDEICSEDQLTVWVYNNTICSVFVELGHGYVKLADYASYIGGMVEIGYDVIVPVTENMLLTVREGEYMLRISKGNDVGTKPVNIVKNQELELSLADIAIEPKQTGSILFRVTPSDAKVYIDGRKVNTEGAVELIYGKHKINIIAEGYETYSASFNVNYAYKIKDYALKSKEESNEKENKTTQNVKVTTADSTTEKTTQASTSQNETTEATTESTTNSDNGVKDVSSTTGTKTTNKVTVNTPVGASVYFDGEYIGIAPMSFTKVTGSHIITLSMSGYLSKSYTVTFTDDGKDESLQYEALTSIASLIE